MSAEMISWPEWRWTAAHLAERLPPVDEAMVVLPRRDVLALAERLEKMTADRDRWRVVAEAYASRYHRPRALGMTAKVLLAAGLGVLIVAGLLVSAGFHAWDGGGR